MASLGISIGELVSAVRALGMVGMTASEAAARMESAIATLPVHYRSNITQTVCPICEEEERRATRCPATELLNLSEDRTPLSPKFDTPKIRLIRED
mgnify:FL=1